MDIEKGKWIRVKCGGDKQYQCIFQITVLPIGKASLGEGWAGTDKVKLDHF